MSFTQRHSTHVSPAGHRSHRDQVEAGAGTPALSPSHGGPRDEEQARQPELRPARWRRWAGQREVALYLVLAYVISWSIWPLVLLNPQSSPLVPFGPGLAAVLIALTVGGRAGLLSLLGQLRKWRVKAAWYGIALGVPLAVPALALSAAVAIADAPVPHWEASDVAQLAGTLVVTIIIVGLFEELGWRGFLLPRLQRRHSELTAALILGVTWLPWHLPEMVSDPGQRPLAPFAVYVMAQSVLLAWLYNATQASLPIVIVFHAAFNSCTKLLLSELHGDPKVVAWWTLASAVTILAVSVTVYGEHRRGVHAETVRAVAAPARDDA